MAAMDQKLRILYLMDILLERTDEEHLLNASELIGILNSEYGLSADRRTIYTDLEILSRYGLDIVQKKGTNSGYFIGERDFELPELRLLVDAVQSSRFITEQKSLELISKLEKLCSKSQAAMLHHRVFLINRPKAENEAIYYQVDAIHRAIENNREISFQYAEWTPQKKFRLRKEGSAYTVSPWALTWSSENYYLVAYDANAGKIKHYRVDKMQHTALLETERKGQGAFANFNLPEFSTKTFGMYGGRDEEVSLLCENYLAGVMLDRFGHSVWMVPVDQDHFRIRTVISVSPQFFGWLSGLGSGIRIEGPEYVKNEYVDYIRKILENY